MPQPPKEGFRFVFGGVNLTSVPDSIPPEKYASAANVRGYSPNSIRTRPGYSKLFGTSNNNSGASITDIQSYAALGTDNDPRFLARDANGNIWLDSGNTTGNNAVGTNVGNMAAPQGFGASMLPWRPSQSPQTWMYIATQGDYQKFSAPGNNNAVTQYKVGIAEPQTALGAVPVAPQFTNFTGNNSNWTASGTATLTGNGNIISDTAGTPIPDPLSASRYSVPVTVNYYVTGSLVLANNANYLEVQDSIPPIANSTVTAIRYTSGNNGNCQIVCGPFPIGEGPTSPTILGSLRRGAIVNVSNNSSNENVFVQSATAGPNGSVMFECSPTTTRSANDSITGVQTIVVDGNISNGQSITQPAVDSTITAGTGVLSQTLAVNPFATPIGTSGALPTEDDYVRVLILANNIAALTQIQITFVCDTYTTFTYTQNSLQNLAAGELGLIEFPISALVASSTSGSLAGCTSVKVTVTTTGTQSFDISSLHISGSGLPDVGQTGSPYFYLMVGRSTATGATGNPSPPMRYGVSPRRQNVTLSLPSVASVFPAADAQIDIYDIYRYGGTITNYRYIGSGAPSTTFTDKYFDDTAAAGNEISYQNFEPWPSVDVPYNVSSGGGTTLTVTGSKLVISGPTTWPSTILRWLPGTLVLLGGQTAYTLRKRPTALSATSYLLDLAECAGSLSATSLSIAEPNVARQILPYTFGPDQYGYFFGVGDALRPGTVYFANSNNPDSTSSSNTVEPSTPSEPMIGGEVIDGISFVSSSDRWWAMYPAFSGNTVFSPYQVDVGRGAAAPSFATDKTSIFFWAKDGICAHQGGQFQSLTDADLYLLFPHEDVPGQDIVRNGVTYYAPDYSRAATFRLAWVNGFLYADYQDSTGTPRSLVCYLKTLAWSQDIYANSITCRCAMVQPEGTLTTSPGESYGLAVMADNQGNVYAPSLTAGDNGANISCTLATFEWDGEPTRQSGLWNSWYLDCVPVSGLTVNSVMFGVAQTPQIPATTIGASSSRVLVECPVPDGSLNRFLGVQITWSDAAGAAFTLLHSWRNFADPDSVFTWNTQKTTFGLHGYLFCGRIELAYSSTAAVTINLTTFDGTSSETMTVPSTGGEIQKILVTPTFNKGQLYLFSATSSAPMQIFGKNSLLWVRQWGSPSQWSLFPLAADDTAKP